MITFIGWMVILLLVMGWFLWTGRKSRNVMMQSEDVASDALPTIGAIAERQHSIRFGRPPTNTPGPPGSSVWYPPLKKKNSH